MKTFRWYKILPFVFLIILGIGIWMNAINNQRGNRTINKEFDSLDFNGAIDSVWQRKGYVIFKSIEHNKVYGFLPYAPKKYSVHDYIELLQNSVKIVKSALSDTIYIYSGDRSIFPMPIIRITL